MAAPHVAGTWAILRQAIPAASVSTILNALRQTGRPITDTREFGNGLTQPRVSIFEALALLAPATNPAPVLTSLAPARLRAGPSPATLTLIGSGFDAFSVAYWNGAPKPTTLVSTTELQAEISAADLAASANGAGVDLHAAAGWRNVCRTDGDDRSAAVVDGERDVRRAVRPCDGHAGEWLRRIRRLACARLIGIAKRHLRGLHVRRRERDRADVDGHDAATPGPYEFRLFLEQRLHPRRDQSAGDRGRIHEPGACHSVAVAGCDSGRQPGLHPDSQRLGIRPVLGRALEWIPTRHDLCDFDASCRWQSRRRMWPQRACLP